MSDFKVLFGQRIKELRKNRGLTQEKLAELVGMNQRQLSRIESGVNFASSETIVRLSIALDVEPKCFFEFDWQYSAEYLRTGTDERPLLRLVEKDNIVTVKSASVEPKVIKEIRKIPADKSEESMIILSKKLNKPVTVEYFVGKNRIGVRTYYPDGTIENVITEQETLLENRVNALIDKIKKLSSDTRYLEYLELATEALNDKKSFEELQLILKGIELKFH